MSSDGTTWRSQKGSDLIKDRARATRSSSAGSEPAADVFAPADVFAVRPPQSAPDVFAPRSEPDVFAPPAAASYPAPRSALDPMAILDSVGEVPYAWSIADDTLTWGANAADVLTIRDREAMMTSRGFAKLLDAETAQVRFD